jgi:nicotinamidase-related amidase
VGEKKQEITRIPFEKFRCSLAQTRHKLTLIAKVPHFRSQHSHDGDFMRLSALIFPLLLFMLLPAVEAGQKDVELTIRTRKPFDTPDKKVDYQEVKLTRVWSPKQTAVIVCDMWDTHHCYNAVKRVEELAPRMNEVLEKARSMGMLIIHAPSSCMEPYKDHPARKRAKDAPKAKNLPKDISVWCNKIPSEEKGKYPIDQSDGGCDSDPAEQKKHQENLAKMGRNPAEPWKSQIAVLKIYDQDIISDSGVEIWNVLEERGINNVILLGVHTNMCVLGRPFGLRQMVKNGKNVVLMRDMTDTMYNPKSAPYVNHYKGTELIIEHIEKFVCPTITSDAIVGGKPFRFKNDPN